MISKYTEVNFKVSIVLAQFSTSVSHSLVVNLRSIQLERSFLSFSGSTVDDNSRRGGKKSKDQTRKTLQHLTHRNLR
ncbi:Hypothetical predicted protein [Octopus vulgaris]|uniref:Uncharacterized protein n=1 Tax=Octopus vulgaris TaxID=6645 RepID=A0AA36AXG6_OCTVU|nr:Hypothetical predicted protein [Octopus vulgaris]